MQLFAGFTSVLLHIASKYKTTLTPSLISYFSVKFHYPFFLKKNNNNKNSIFPLEGIGKWNLNAVTLVQGPFLSILMEPDKWMLWGNWRMFRQRLSSLIFVYLFLSELVIAEAAFKCRCNPLSHLRPTCGNKWTVLSVFAGAEHTWD